MAFVAGARREHELRSGPVKAPAEQRTKRALDHHPHGRVVTGTKEHIGMVEAHTRGFDRIGKRHELGVRGGERGSGLRILACLHESATEARPRACGLAAQARGIELRDHRAEGPAGIVSEPASRERFSMLGAQPQQVPRSAKRFDEIDRGLELPDRRGQIAPARFEVGDVALRDRRRQSCARAEVGLVRRDKAGTRFVEAEESQQRLAAVVLELAEDQGLAAERRRCGIESLQGIDQLGLALEHDAQIDVGASEQGCIAPRKQRGSRGLPFGQRFVEPAGLDQRVHRGQLRTRALLEQSMMPCPFRTGSGLHERRVVLAGVGQRTGPRALGSHLHRWEPRRAGFGSQVRQALRRVQRLLGNRCLERRASALQVRTVMVRGVAHGTLNSRTVGVPVPAARSEQA